MNYTVSRSADLSVGSFWQCAGSLAAQLCYCSPWLCTVHVCVLYVRDTNIIWLSLDKSWNQCVKEVTLTWTLSFPVISCLLNHSVFGFLCKMSVAATAKVNYWENSSSRCMYSCRSSLLTGVLSSADKSCKYLKVSKFSVVQISLQMNTGCWTVPRNMLAPVMWRNMS